MTSVESSSAYMDFALQDLATAVLYRLATYAVINLIDDAAMLSLVFI
ncbi:hypothetical protein [Limnohabitans sp. TS-CS-82]|nr:hypothetical protein [Limnohabitans sp. TS-CS-82]